MAEQKNTKTKQIKKSFYHDNELLGLMHVIKRAEPILRYLKERGWSDCKTIAKDLNLDELQTSFLMVDLSIYGLVKSELRVVVPPTPTEMGHAASNFNLSDDFEKRIGELNRGIERSSVMYAKRHAEAYEADNFKRLLRMDSNLFDEVIKRLVRNN